MLKFAVETVEWWILNPLYFSSGMNPQAGYSGQRSRIIRKIEMLGPLDQEQKDRLIQIADLCPIHKMLNNGTKIETQQI